MFSWLINYIYQIDSSESAGKHTQYSLASASKYTQNYRNLQHVSANEAMAELSDIAAQIYRVFHIQHSCYGVFIQT